MEDYTNEGFGLVFTDQSKADTLENMFKVKSFWTNVELNDRLGWQFSQAIYALRHRKNSMNIVTVHLGGRRYAAELRPGQYAGRNRGVRNSEV